MSFDAVRRSEHGVYQQSPHHVRDGAEPVTAPGSLSKFSPALVWEWRRLPYHSIDFGFDDQNLCQLQMTPDQQLVVTATRSSGVPICVLVTLEAAAVRSFPVSLPLNSRGYGGIAIGYQKLSDGTWMGMRTAIILGSSPATAMLWSKYGDLSAELFLPFGQTWEMPLVGGNIPIHLPIRSQFVPAQTRACLFTEYSYPPPWYAYASWYDVNPGYTPSGIREQMFFHSDKILRIASEPLTYSVVSGSWPGYSIANYAVAGGSNELLLAKPILVGSNLILLTRPRFTFSGPNRLLCLAIDGSVRWSHTVGLTTWLATENRSRIEGPRALISDGEFVYVAGTPYGGNNFWVYSAGSGDLVDARTLNMPPAGGIQRDAAGNLYVLHNYA